MFLIALGVSKLPSTLPPIALAGLTGLNASAVGLIFYAALQLSRSTSTTHTTRLILLGVAAISSCYSSIWLFPVLTLNGGVVTLIADWSGWRRFGSKLKRKPAESGADRIDTAASIALEEVGLPGRPAGPSTPPTHITRLPSPPPSPNLLEAPSLRRRPNNSLPIASPVEDTTTTLDAPTSINLNVTILQAGMVLALFFTIIITVVVLRATMREQSRGLQLFTNLYIAGSILFGGGPAVVPLLQVRVSGHRDFDAYKLLAIRATSSHQAGCPRRTFSSASHCCQPSRDPTSTLPSSWVHCRMLYFNQSDV